MDITDRKNNKYHANPTKLTFARISSVCTCHILYLYNQYVNGNAKNVVFVVKRYAVLKSKLERTQKKTVHSMQWGGGSPLNIKLQGKYQGKIHRVYNE